MISRINKNNSNTTNNNKNINNKLYIKISNYRVYDVSNNSSVSSIYYSKRRSMGSAYYVARVKKFPNNKNYWTC